MLEGLLLVDKKKGDSSFDVVAQLRRALSTRSVGHTGTLDPFATGLLVVLVGRYTRLSDYLTKQDKVYEARVCFGTSTTTDDLCGDVLASVDPSYLDESTISRALENFMGPQLQMPPQFSAISINGERAYKKARRGEVALVQPRAVHIYNIQLLRWEKPFADIWVHCSKGTYIRAIARDLGEKLGVPAHLSELRRKRVGEYYIEECDGKLQIGIDAIRGIPKIEVSALIAEQLRQGKRPDFSSQQIGIALAHHDGNLVAIVRAEDNRLISVRGF